MVYGEGDTSFRAAGGEAGVEGGEPRSGDGDEFIAGGSVGGACVPEFLIQREERGADGVEGGAVAAHPGAGATDGLFRCGVGRVHEAGAGAPE